MLGLSIEEKKIGDLTHRHTSNSGMWAWTSGAASRTNLSSAASKSPYRVSQLLRESFSELRAAPKAPVGGTRKEKRSWEGFLRLVLTRVLKVTFIWGGLRCLSSASFLCPLPLHSSVTLKTQNGGAQAGLEAVPPSVFQTLWLPRMNFSSEWISNCGNSANFKLLLFKQGSLAIPYFQIVIKNNLLFGKTGGADTAQHHPKSLGSGVKTFPTTSALSPGFQPHLIPCECGGSSVR